MPHWTRHAATLKAEIVLPGYASGKTWKHSPGAILEEFNALVAQPAHRLSGTLQ